MHTLKAANQNQIMHIISKQKKTKCIKQGTYSRTHEKLNRTELYSANMREGYSF